MYLSWALIIIGGLVIYFIGKGAGARRSEGRIQELEDKLEEIKEELEANDIDIDTDVEDY